MTVSRNRRPYRVTAVFTVTFGGYETIHPACPLMLKDVQTVAADVEITLTAKLNEPSVLLFEFTLNDWNVSTAAWTGGAYATAAIRRAGGGIDDFDTGTKPWIVYMTTIEATEEASWTIGSS